MWWYIPTLYNMWKLCDNRKKSISACKSYFKFIHPQKAWYYSHKISITLTTFMRSTDVKNSYILFHFEKKKQLKKVTSRVALTISFDMWRTRLCPILYPNLSRRYMSTWWYFKNRISWVKIQLKETFFNDRYILYVRK